jgi:transcriptional regulator with XRE-family HTH domain
MLLVRSINRAETIVNTSQKTAQVREIKILMAQRGLTVAGLAALCGVASVSLSNQLSNNFAGSQRLRIIVENVLGRPFWSGAAQFKARLRLIERLAFDPETKTAAELSKYLTSHKIRRSKSGRRRSDLIKLLNSTYQTKTTNPQ